MRLAILAAVLWVIPAASPALSRDVGGGAPPLMVAAPWPSLAGQPLTDRSASYHLKEADIFIPSGAKPGSISRTIRPFGPWTLICDSNTKTRQRICNASQTFVDKDSKLVFSWSLAATRGGAPVFIVRVPSDGAKVRLIHFALRNKDKANFDLALTDCNASICLGFLELNRDFQAQIDTLATVDMTYDPAGSAIAVAAPLQGLSAAIKSITR